ncbi:MAG: BolA family transcriptional regulator [Coxiella sp. RIFCSPHIGHO2_12_FULL_44_14]|nr:MAG: BolA family transcriptional regulator [Coxiella sp. RIFCSPHIGHO2_12_FULL_44_14]
MVTAQNIKHWIELHLANSQAFVEGDGHHFTATVICADFMGLSTLERHRRVYSALGNRMQADIHALSLKVLTPEESSRGGER